MLFINLLDTKSSVKAKAYNLLVRLVQLGHQRRKKPSWNGENRLLTKIKIKNKRKEIFFDTKLKKKKKNTEPAGATCFPKIGIFFVLLRELSDCRSNCVLI